MGAQGTAELDFGAWPTLEDAEVAAVGALEFTGALASTLADATLDASGDIGGGVGGGGGGYISPLERMAMRNNMAMMWNSARHSPSLDPAIFDTEQLG